MVTFLFCHGGIMKYIYGLLVVFLVLFGGYAGAEGTKKNFWEESSILTSGYAGAGWSKSVEAIFQGGKYYSDENFIEAYNWWKKAAKLGHPTAQYNLGFMYDHGEGVTQNYKNALKWYMKAAESGNRSAQNNLAIMYYEGKGVTQNYIEAYKWLNIAAITGHKQSIKFRDELLNLLSRSQIEQGQKLALKWSRDNSFYYGLLDDWLDDEIIKGGYTVTYSGD